MRYLFEKLKLCICLMMQLNSVTVCAAPVTIDINSDEYIRAYHWLSKDGWDLDKQLFPTHPPFYQAYLLGDYASVAEDYKLAIYWLTIAEQEFSSFNQVDQQILTFKQGFSYDKVGDSDKAKQYYRKSIELGYADSCVNLGVIYEQQHQYEKARTLYESCIPELESALLYMNLGTLYYNGLVKRDRKLGGKYWLKSAELNPDNTDIQYNLGIYYFHTEHELGTVKYYFSQCSSSYWRCANGLKMVNKKLDPSGLFY